MDDGGRGHVGPGCVEQTTCYLSCHSGLVLVLRLNLLWRGEGVHVTCAAGQGSGDMLKT